MFVILIIVTSIIFVYLMSTTFRVRVREHGIRVDRPWRDWKPANAFSSPVNRKLKTEKVEHED